MSNRPTFVPIFEETETVIRDRMLGNISDEWRKEPGDFMYDAVAANPIEVKQLQANQDEILKNRTALYAEGEWLDAIVAEVGLTRQRATQNKRLISVTADAGVIIPQGHTLLTVVLDGDGNTLEYTTDKETKFTVSATQGVEITCTIPGIIGNVATGSEFILNPAIPGVRIITDTGTTLSGEDTESDNELYLRYHERINKPDTGGNRNDYVRWAKELKDSYGEDLIGAAKCIPRWNGNNTVKVIVVDKDMLPASVELVKTVQDYLDPGITGLGDGKAPCGAAVTVAAATAVPINVSVTSIEWDPLANTSESKAAFTEAIRAYLARIVFTGSKVVYNQIAGLLITTKGVINYTGLKVNGGTVDVTVGAEAVATLGTVTI